MEPQYTQPQQTPQDAYELMSEAHLDEASISVSVKTPDCLRQNYQFIRVIGEGANGKTYLALCRTTHKKVAIKALKLVDQFKSLELFRREAATLSQIQVHGVPQFIDFVESEESLDECYLIQEFFDYPSIQQMIDERNESGTSFSEFETMHIMQGLGEILHALQTQYSPPIIHRDIKPSNILYDEKQKKVMLIDFGSVANPSKKTGGSTVAGTQGFMAPEQLMGECTVQSDFYALGATALYMLTGISPVDMEYDKANPFLIKCDALLEKKNVSLGMQKLIQELMSPQVENRPNNAYALTERLQQARAESLSPQKPLPPAFKFLIKHHKIILPPVALIFIWLTITSLIAIYQFPRISTLMEFWQGAVLTFFEPSTLILTVIMTFVCVYLIPKLIRYLHARWLKSQIRKLEAVAGYQNHELVIHRDNLPHQYAECVFYDDVNQTYRYYYGKVKVGEQVTLGTTTYTVTDGSKQFLRA